MGAGERSALDSSSLPHQGSVPRERCARVSWGLDAVIFKAARPSDTLPIERATTAWAAGAPAGRSLAAQACWMCPKCDGLVNAVPVPSIATSAPSSHRNARPSSSGHAPLSAVGLRGERSGCRPAQPARSLRSPRQKPLKRPLLPRWASGQQRHAHGSHAGRSRQRQRLGSGTGGPPGERGCCRRHGRQHSGSPPPALPSCHGPVLLSRCRHLRCSDSAWQPAHTQRLPRTMPHCAGGCRTESTSACCRHACQSVHAAGEDVSTSVAHD